MEVLSFNSIKYVSLSFATFLFTQVHPCGRYRHNTVVFILAKEYNLKNLRTIHRLDRLTSGLLLFGRTPKKARSMEHQIRNRQVQKEYVCRVEGEFPRYDTVTLWCYNQQYHLTFQVQISSQRLAVFIYIYFYFPQALQTSAMTHCTKNTCLIVLILLLGGRKKVGESNG